MKKRGKLKKSTKNLMHLVMDERIELVPIMHQISHYRYCNSILKWLISNRITGMNLLDWIKIYHSNSVMCMVKFIIKHYNKERENRAIILNRDWIK